MFVIVCILFIIAFFSNFLIHLHLLPEWVPWITEPLIYFFFCIAFVKAKNNIKFPFFGFFAMLCLVGFGSAVVNHNLGLQTLLGMRLVFRFYIFFLGLVNADFNLKQLKKINKLIVFIFLIQLPVSVVRLFIYGQGEQAVGTYAYADGASPIVITLVAVCFSIAFYLYYKASWKYIIVAILFIGLSFIGGKRGILFFLPVTVVYTVLTTFLEKSIIKTKVSMYEFKIILVSIMFILITAIGGARLLATLNPEHKVGGSFNLGHILTYAKEYTAQRNPFNKKYTAGRYSTTKQVISVLYQKGLARAFFGYGPGAYGKSRFKERREKGPIFRDIFIQYGLTCLNYTAMEYGFAGVFIYLSFIFFMNYHLYKNWRYHQSDYWKAVSFGTYLSGFVYLMIWVSYSSTIYTGDYLPLLFFYLFGQSVICGKYFVNNDTKSPSFVS